MTNALPEGVASGKPVKVTQAKPKRAPKKSANKPVAPVEALSPPVETPVVVPPPAASIGELSTGGGANLQNQQEANDLITLNERRLDEFSKTATSEQQTQLRQVRYFLKQARQALSTGDAEGATTLATKAKLLMDDFNK